MLRAPRPLNARRRRIILLLLCVASALWLITSQISTYGYFALQAFVSSALDSGIIPLCILRKPPVLFVHNEDYVYVTWESSCYRTPPLVVEWQQQPYWQYADGSSHAFDDKVVSNFSAPIYETINSKHIRAMALIGPLVRDERMVVAYRLIAASATSVPRRLVASGPFVFVCSQRDPSPRPDSDQKGRAIGNVTMLVVGDNQMGERTFRQILLSVKASTRAAGTSLMPGRPRLPAFDYILHAGDIVQRAWQLGDWENNMFGPLTNTGIGQTTPMIFVPGNHDYLPSAGTCFARNLYLDLVHNLTDLAPLAKFCQYASEPQPPGSQGNGSASSSCYSGHQAYFAVTVAGARIIVLDSECDTPDQMRFLESELQSANSDASVRYVIVAVHIPPYLEYWDPVAFFELGEKDWDQYIREVYDPLFRKYGVDLVISGHQHNYQRSVIDRGGAGGSLDKECVQKFDGMYEVGYIGYHYVELTFASDGRLHWLARDALSAIIIHVSRAG
ncbi:hypothetical protein EV182_001044 [Spiromyces aspiralis]|uniref:Uncharacterized protein n=1 Tax=Spiromyces aspiralis TaxID=68401 RepID=A0ACC1HJY8_9FUNG|nr:hypothetical protein EV182_001044 [Spiromyces aspiralis]